MAASPAWTIHNDRLTDAITKNASRKLKKLCKKSTMLLDVPHPLTAETPLYTAVRWKRTKAIKILLQHGAKTDIQRPKFNDTALHLAAMEGKADVIRLLLEAGAERQICNFNGHTPIDLAIDQRQQDAIDLLVVPPLQCREPICQDSSLNTITVRWIAPQSKGSPIQNYTLRVYEESASSSTISIPPLRTHSMIQGSSCTHTVDQCIPGVTYYISIQACNEAGWNQESIRTSMRARPTPPSKPPVPFVIATGTTFLSIDWKQTNTNGYSISCYEVGYRVILLTPTLTTRRRLTPDETNDQAICDAIIAANNELKEAKRQEKVWLAIFAPLDHDLSEQAKEIVKGEKALVKMNRDYKRCVDKVHNKKSKKKKKKRKKRILTEGVEDNGDQKVVGHDDDDDKDDNEDDDEDEEDDTAVKLRQAHLVLSEKVQTIERARATIYKNGVLVQTWQHEQELRHAMDQVNEFKENLKVWARSQAVEAKKRAESRIKTLEWNIEGSTRRLDSQKKELQDRSVELNNQRHEAQLKHTNAINFVEQQIIDLKQQFWKVLTIGGSKMKNDILKMQNTGRTSADDSIPSGGTLTKLSPSTQFVMRIRAKNAVGWSPWSDETAPHLDTAKTADAPFSIGNRIASNRLLLSWETSLTVPLPLPLWSDLRLEFQDQTSHSKRQHEWIECLKYVDPLSEIKRLKEQGGFKKKTKSSEIGETTEESKVADVHVPKNPLKDKTEWDLPLVEIDKLLPGHLYRFRLVECGNNKPTVLGGGASNWIRTASDVPGAPRTLCVLGETASSITVTFAPPHVGPTDKYDIEFQRGVLIREQQEYINTGKLKRNLQHQLRPSGPWRHSGSLIEGTKSNDPNSSALDTTADENLQTTTHHQYVLNKLIANEFYRIRVSARNANGSGEATTTTLWVKTLPLPPTPSTLPPYVTGRSSRSLVVEWEQANGFGELVLSYRVEIRERCGKEYAEQSSSDDEDKEEEEEYESMSGRKNEDENENENEKRKGKWRVAGLVAKSTEEDDGWRSIEVMDLLPGQTYEFRLSANSLFGFGSCSKKSRPIQCEYEPPAIIDTLLSEVGDNTKMIKLTWRKPNAWGLAVDVYDIEIQSKQNILMWTKVCDTVKHSRFIGHDLMPAGIPHRFRIRSASRVGYSKWSKETDWLALDY